MSGCCTVRFRHYSELCQIIGCWYSQVQPLFWTLSDVWMLYSQVQALFWTLSDVWMLCCQVRRYSELCQMPGCCTVRFMRYSELCQMSGCCIQAGTILNSVRCLDAVQSGLCAILNSVRCLDAVYRQPLFWTLSDVWMLYSEAQAIFWTLSDVWMLFSLFVPVMEILLHTIEDHLIRRWVVKYSIITCVTRSVASVYFKEKLNSKCQKLYLS
jgi:hypothetical protein